MGISEDARGGEDFERCNRSSRARTSARFRALVIFLAAAWVAACGGGGGSGDSPPPPPPAVSGYVVKGPIAAATVKLYSITTDGTKTLLGATTSDRSGFYSFNIAPATDSVILVEASGGSYEDEISATRVLLAETLRAAAIVSSAALRVSVSPFSEAAVREIDSASPKNWAPARVSGVNAAFSTIVGSFLELNPADLSSDEAAQKASNEDFLLALELGGFSGMLHRLGSSQAPAPLDQGLSAVRTVMSDRFDDQYAPIWLRGIVDFIDVTGLSANVKRELKGIFVLLNPYASDTDIAAALPTGQATGSASAPMPNDAFEWVPDPYYERQSPVGTIFNTRGALVAYQLSPSFNTYRYLSSGSVGELYGDGDVGIGRWHGGVVFYATDGRALNTATNPQIYSASQGIPYAVARPATDLPLCGIRLLQLAGATLPTQTAGPGIKPVTGLTADSSIGVQYTGATAYLGLDIGLQMADGSVSRVRTTGGSAAPWANGMSTAPDQSFSTFFFAPAPPQLPGLEINVNGMLAGAGGRKAAIKLQIYSTAVDAMTFAAAFSGSDTPPDNSGCAVSSPGDGSAIVPPPADGTYSVFAGTDSSNSLYMGAPFTASFRATGALTAALSLTIPVDTPIFELAGNAYAAIGRAKGPFTLRGVNYNRSLPYAVAQAPGIFPTTGTRRYVLVASSAAIATVRSGSTDFELPPGQVTNATLDISFGEYPAGTASPWYGSARVLVEGSVEGFNFSVSSGDLRYGRSTGAFGDFGNVEGAVSGPNAEFAVVRYLSGIGSAPVQGVLFLQAQ